MLVGREGNDFFRPCSSAFNSFLLWFCLVLFLLVILRYQPIRVKILPWFPGVVARGIALPLNQEVHLAPSASWLRIQDLLDFEFLFPFYQIRRWTGKVWPVYVTSRNRSIHFSLFYPMITFSL